MNESDKSVREPALDDEAAGLECFATETVPVVETADDAAVLAIDEMTALYPEGDIEDIAPIDTTQSKSPARRRAPSLNRLVGWRTYAQSQLARETIVIASIVLVGLLASRIVNQPLDSVNGLVAVSVAPTLSEPRPQPVVAVLTQPMVRLVPEVRPARVTVPRRTTLEKMTAKPRATTAVSPASGPAPRSTRPRAEAPPPRTTKPSQPVPSTAPIPSPLVASAAPEVTAAAPEVNVQPAPELARAVNAPVAFTAPNDQSSIQRVLEAYRVAYEQLDASSAAAIWPGVDTRALNRAFQALAEQDVSFDSCQVDIKRVNANARCVGEIRYVGRVGDQVPRVRRLSWSFELERVSDGWQIAQVAAR